MGPGGGTQIARDKCEDGGVKREAGRPYRGQAPTPKTEGQLE